MLSTAYADREAQVGALRLHYQEWGDPALPPVVLLHGFGVSGHMFDEFGALASDRYHLFVIDQRGHGDSDWASDGDYSREAFVGDLEGFRRAVGLERFVLVGHSMGGLNAVVYATQHPERVDRLILVDVGPEAAREGVDNIVRFTRGPDNLEFEQYVEMAHRFNPRRSVENIRERMRHRLRPTGDGKWTWKFDRRFRDPESGIRVGSSMSSDDLWSLFGRVTVPTLLVRGGESDVLTQEVADRVVREMPHANLVVVPGAGHSVPGDNPAAFTDAVLDFLSRPVVEGPPDEPSPKTEGGPEQAPRADWWDDVAVSARAEAMPEEASAEPTPAATQAATSPAREALRRELSASTAAPPARGRRPTRRRPGTLIVVGGIALAAIAAIVGVRSLTRRKADEPGTGRGRRRARSREQPAGATRERALGVFDELTSLGRDRLEQARGLETRAVEYAREAVDRAPGRKSTSKRKRGGGGAARLAGRGVRAVGGLAVREGRSLLGTDRPGAR